MGLEASYQAIPADCNLLKRSIADAAFGTHLSIPSALSSWEAEPHWEGEDEDFRTEVKRLHQDHPGLQDRHYTLDRSWDILCYLISPARRKGDLDNPDPGLFAIRGQIALADHLECGQGFKLKFNPPQTVVQIVEFLQTVDLKAAWNPEDMVEQGVYKFFGESPHHCEKLAAELLQFYRRAAAQQEGVLVWIN